MEEFKDSSEVVAKKLSTMDDSRLRNLAEDPIGNITTANATDSVWEGMSEDEIKEAAQAEIEKRGL
jgi:hypothetical protein